MNYLLIKNKNIDFIYDKYFNIFIFSHFDTELLLRFSMQRVKACSNNSEIYCSEE